MKGYSLDFFRRVMAADERLVGVQLGRAAIDKGVPIARIARELGVSRQAVYDWFTGVYNPSEETVDAIVRLLKN